MSIENENIERPDFPNDRIVRQRDSMRNKRSHYSSNPNDRAKGNSSGGGCFIATACYGDYDCEEVIILRKFRDEKLLRNFIGIKFVNFYYKCSPPLAKSLEKNDKVKNYIKSCFLNPVVKSIKQIFKY